MNSAASWFKRLLLPGLAFKAAVIGGGYATGRELAAFFLSCGPRGGLLAMLLSTGVFSLVCSITYLYAVRTASRDYRTFFAHLLGPLWPIFEIVYFLSIIVILAAFAAATGALGQAALGWPDLVGSLLFVGAVTAFAVAGPDAVEGLFKYVSLLLYATYATFIVLSLNRFGSQISHTLSVYQGERGWVTGGLTYAGYNLLGAIVILPVLRHVSSHRDALIAGLLSGPLTMLPGFLFFLCMLGGYPDVEHQLLPSTYLLQKLGSPIFQGIFQVMIFAALLESATSGVHAINERVARAFLRAHARTMTWRIRLVCTLAVLVGSVFVASRFGLVALIGEGYRWVALAILLLYVVPLLTRGIWQLFFQVRGSAAPPLEPALESSAGSRGLAKGEGG